MEEITLGTFVQQLTLRMEQARLVMLFKDETPWHLLFYRLKTNESANARFLAKLRFDWDGPYPRCQELSEFIQALHWTGTVVAANPSYERIALQDDVRKLWAESAAEIGQDLDVLLNASVEIARQEFPHQQA